MQRDTHFSRLDCCSLIWEDAFMPGHCYSDRCRRGCAAPPSAGSGAFRARDHRPGGQSCCGSRLSPALPRGFSVIVTKPCLSPTLREFPAVPFSSTANFQPQKDGEFLSENVWFFTVVVCSLLLTCRWHQVESQSHEVTSFSCPAAAARAAPQPGMIWHLHVEPHSRQLG